MKILIVYYSRTGITRTCAQLMRQAIEGRGGHEVVVEELADRKKRGGMFGWLGAGKDAATKAEAEIEPVQADPSAFDLVLVGTPVWAFTMASAVRSFLARHGTRCPKVAFFCTMGGSGDKKTFAHMQELCGKAPVVTLALIDKKVKADHAEKYVAAVEGFVKVVLGQ